LTRRLIPDTLQPYGTTGDTWTDYDGDEPYGDFSVDASLGSFVRNKRSFEPGLGRFEWLSANEPDGSTAAYYHTDHLGTIRGVTDYIAGWGEGMTFTAFGERVVGTQNSTSTRFGYVGSFGYQASGEYPFLHVGARYYDPASGRFLQRDPIGIRGGVNVYAYVESIPTDFSDPSGLGGGLLPGPQKKPWPLDRQLRERPRDKLERERQRILDEIEHYEQRERTLKRLIDDLRSVRQGSISIGVAILISPGGSLAVDVAIGICADIIIGHPESAE
jgi:RHS repeat-associated protein